MTTQAPLLTVVEIVDVAWRVPAKIAVPTCVAPSQSVTCEMLPGDDVASTHVISRDTRSSRIASLTPEKRRTPSVTFEVPPAATAYEGLDASRVTVSVPLPVMVMVLPAASAAVAVVGVIVCEDVRPTPLKVVLPAVSSIPKLKSPDDALPGISHLTPMVFTVPFVTVSIESSVYVSSPDVAGLTVVLVRRVAPSQRAQLVGSIDILSV